MPLHPPPRPPDRRAAERRLRLARRRIHRLLEVTGVLNQAHASAPSPASRLHEERVPDFLGRLRSLVGVGDEPRGLRDRDSGGLRRLSRLDLVPGKRKGLARGTDEGKAGLLARCRELRALGEEAVARVDRIGPDLQGLGHQRLDVQVSPHRMPRLTDSVRLVGLLPVQRVPVLWRVDGNGANTQLVSGPKGPYSYLPSVRNQDLFQHRRSLPSSSKTVTSHKPGTLAASTWPNLLPGIVAMSLIISTQTVGVSSPKPSQALSAPVLPKAASNLTEMQDPDVRISYPNPLS